MAEMTRISLRVPDDIPAKLAELAGGGKKMGDYLTVLIRDIHAGQRDASGAGELDLVSGAVKHLSAKYRELDARVTQLERRP